MWGGYQYNQKGEIKAPPDTKIEVSLAQAEITMEDQLKRLATLAKRLKASRGSLSPSEQIYLDSSEALIIITSINQRIEACFTEIILQYKEAIKEAEAHWQDTIRRAQEIATSLSSQEVLNALADGGANQQLILDKPIRYYEEKMIQAKKIKNHYQTLISQIKAGIDQQLSQDKALAKEVFS